MSGLAQLSIAQGHCVSGSDSADSRMLDRIRSLGGAVFIGHEAARAKGADCVVYSSSIAPDNPELLWARNNGIPVLHRSEILNRLVRGRRVAAVAGAHGKSTTTALLSQLFTAAGMDPTVLLGAELESLGGNVRSGKGGYAVVEADESDASFLRLSPWAAVITNIDDEHMDYYRNPGEILEAYDLFAERIRPDGFLVACWDDPGVRRLFGFGPRRLVTYGFSRGARVRAEDVELGPGWSRYTCFLDGKKLGSVELRVPGEHNVLNTLSVIGLAQEIGLNFRMIRTVLGEFRGTKRRFQLQGEVGGVLVVEDYAHHPAEIETTLKAARQWQGRRIRVVFQPHRYSRTRYLLDRFAACFHLADELTLLPIYSASEDPIEGVTSRALLESVRLSNEMPVKLESPEEVLKRLSEEASPGDMILFLGAGSVGTLSGRLVEALNRRNQAKEAAQHAA